MSRVKKAVIPVAGFGTRFLPATKSQPKEMLALIDKPVIQYIVEEMVASGIEDIILVTSSEKRAIEDHFDHHQALEEHLKAAGKLEELERINRISEMANFIYVRQKGPYGNGTPVLNVRHIIGDEPFVLAFGDSLIKSSIPATRQMLEVFDRFQDPVVSVSVVPHEETCHYGIITGEKVADRTYKISGIIEKPSPADAPSDLAATGRYILTPDIFDILAAIKVQKNREFYVTDAVDILLKRRDFYACEIDGHFYDCGNKLEFLKAITDFALERPDLKDAYAAHLKSLRL